VQVESLHSSARDLMKALVDLVEERVVRVARDAQAVLDEAKHHLARIELGRVRRQVDDRDGALRQPRVQLDGHERRLVHLGVVAHEHVARHQEALGDGLHDELAEVERRVHAVDAVLEKDGILLHVGVMQADHQRDGVVLAQTVVVACVHRLAFRANAAISTQL
jgi:hypothetical protein